MSISKSQHEFEAFALSDAGGLSKGHLVKSEDGEYLNFAAQCYFDFWQGSRETLVAEWPDQHTYTAPDCAGAAILDCRTAYSKALGLKVKS